MLYPILYYCACVLLKLSTICACCAKIVKVLIEILWRSFAKDPPKEEEPSTYRYNELATAGAPGEMLWFVGGTGGLT